MFVITYKFIITLTIGYFLSLDIFTLNEQKNKGSPKTANIYLSAPLL